MRKLAALFTAFILILSTCAVGASAAEYGRNPDHSEVTAKGEYIYYISGNKICRLHITDGKQKTVCEVMGEDPNSLCVMGNYLYYSASYETDDFDSYDAIYKVDIGSGKQTKILDCKDERDEAHPCDIITSGNRLYISFDIFVHEEVNDMYYVNIYDTNGKYLDNFTPCIENYSFFIDASDCEACAAAKVKEIVYTYAEDGDVDDWYAEYTDEYNIVKIKSDLSEERITIPAKIGKNVNRFVYCGEKYIYYTDNNDRLCRYNTETEKYAVLVDGGVNGAHYRNGEIYFVTSGGELKKYKNGSISTVREYPDDEFYLYFFNDYILYYDGGQTYSIIDYSGKNVIACHGETSEGE